ncbi:hypothetical protein [Microbispora sp. NPDC046933]|uniref:hypothetical protein n=1 Tax=Microbispora sp. NPDC046933 TaxID=3155618 RepID=UPI0033DF0AC9
MRPVLVCLTLAALLSASACSGSGSERNGASDESMKRAVAGWREFPAERHPRPIVLLGDLPGTSGAAKGANRAEASIPLPTKNPGSTVVALSDGEARLGQVSAAEAFGALAAHVARIPGEPREIRIVGSQYGVREWDTDRGPTKLPTWTFLTDSGGTAAWPALAPGAFWQLGELRHSVSVEVTSAGPEQTRLSTAMMWPPSDCGDDKPGDDLLRYESESAVLIGLREAGSIRTDCDQNALGRMSERVIQLSKPLGGRVIIDPHGNPVPVRH